jgi:glutathionyl-hydroquinone reductase
MCCADGGVGPTTDEEFLSSICSLVLKDGSLAKFPPEKDRYILYVAAGCPFAARPWVVATIHGLPIQIVRLFPATEEDGWFFEPHSDGEKDLARKIPSGSVDKDPYGHHHLRQLYLKANPNFTGVVSVPLLWDKVNNIAVSNSSLGLSEMLSSQLVPTLATRNTHIELYPTPSSSSSTAVEHTELVKWINNNITSKVYKISESDDAKTHDSMVEEYYKSLTEMQDRLTSNDGKKKQRTDNSNDDGNENGNSGSNSSSSLAFLMGDQVRFADIILWISLIRLDLCYQFRFGLGKLNIREGETNNNNNNKTRIEVVTSYFSLWCSVQNTSQISSLFNSFAIRFTVLHCIVLSRFSPSKTIYETSHGY